MKPPHLHHKTLCLATAGILLLLTLSLISSGTVSADGGSSGHMAAHGTTVGGAATAAPMETVHASYLDLTGNIADLRTRADQWQTGDEASLAVAQEKVECIRTMLSHVAWPQSMSAAISKAKGGVAVMDMALMDKDVTGGQAAAKILGDASHDLTHVFYGDWLPSLKDAKFTEMAPHANYLDLTQNIADLKTRVDQWQKGDEASLGVAQENADRIAALVQHMSSDQAFAKPVQAIAMVLMPVNEALKAKDAAAAQAAMKPLSDASHDLPHDFYTWLDTTAGVKDPACTQSAYLDLTSNVADLRTRITAWEKGDDSSLGIAQEKLGRIEVLVGHTVWPKALAPSVYKIGAALQPMAKALDDKNVAAAQRVAKTMGDGSHDVTHDFYGVWLMSDAAAGGGHAAMMAQGDMGGQASGHGEAVSGTDPITKVLVLGGFGSVNALVIVAAFFLKRTMAKESQVKAAHQAIAAAKGSAR